MQEKECLSIVYAMQKFRHYVLCSHVQVKIMTDHQSLQFMQRPGQAVGRVARWSMIMSEYDYTIQWIPGVDNPVGDNLSRLIKIPDDQWNTVDKDDDTVHPFITLQTKHSSEAGECATCLVSTANTPIRSECNHCGQSFPSRNLLFKHHMNL